MSSLLGDLGLSSEWLAEKLRSSGSVPNEARLLSESSELIGQNRGWCSDVVLCRLTWDGAPNGPNLLPAYASCFRSL